MKKENINNYYTDEDLIGFEKLKNFKEFKVNKINNNLNKSHQQRYAISDNKHFDKIMNINNEKSLSKEIKKTENKDNYYKSSDLKNFDKLNQVLTLNNNKPVRNENEATKTITNYTDKDKRAFDQIIKSKGNTKNYKKYNINLKVDKKKIKIIDFDKLNKKEKNFKNKIGIEKIKIVYFD